MPKIICTICDKEIASILHECGHKERTGGIVLGGYSR